ncbi:MAG: response regulator, partial [Chloroflexi bacterium]
MASYNISLNTCKILVVDDNPDGLILASTLLRRYGATVFEAFDVQEALRILERTDVDFIISDLNMPIMDGWAFVDQLKRNPVTKDIPVIALTAYAVGEGKRRALAAGFHHFLTKPITPHT